MRAKTVVTTITLIVSTATGTPAMAASLTPTPVPNAQTKVVGETRPNVLSPELGEEVVAQGSTRLEPNLDPLTKFYGYDSDGTMLPAPGCIQSTTTQCEATKTEPDENTYLVLACPREEPDCDLKQKGADPNFDYGTHFLFQGHE